MRARGADGQATPLAAGCIAIAAVLVIAFGAMAGDVVDRARAQTAADAAALASIEGGRGAASRLAARHGGTLTSWSRRRGEVTVTVRIGDASAVARATGGPAGTEAPP